MSEAAGSSGAAADIRKLSLAGLGAAAADRLPRMVVPLLGGVYGLDKAGASPLLIVPGIALLALLGPLLHWLRFRYVLTDDELRIEQGFLQRSVRVLPYDRIVDVSIEQPPLARLLGVAVARFDSGGGAGEEAELRYVALVEAEALRALVRSHAAGSRPASGSGDVAAAEDEETLFAMDLPRLLTQGFYSFSLVVFAALLALAGKLDFLLPDGKALLEAGTAVFSQGEDRVLHLGLGSQLLLALAALGGLALLGLASGVARSLIADWGFTLHRRGRTLRRHRGLFTRTDLSVALPRVQSAEIATGPIRRRQGWHRLSLITLGGDGDGGGAAVVAPFAQLDEIATIGGVAGFSELAPTGQQRPDPRPRRDKVLIMGAALGTAALVSALASGPPLWLAALTYSAYAFANWFAWRNSARATAGDMLYARAGWWNNSAVAARMINVQCVTLRSGPLERRYGLASVSFGIFGTHLTFASMPRPEAEAVRDAVLAVIAPVDFSRLNRT